PDDRRVQQVVLTGDGTALFEVMARDHEGWVNQLLSGLDAGEADDLLLGLKRMKQAVQAVLAEENAPSEA
ncbi:MAG TPA: MarR family transcriptional regulator, partial [Hyphomicrobiales bacterium]|nr:MarR family transcriptional regulator [Hyphomicrobiales bacterium]